MYLFAQIVRLLNRKIDDYILFCNNKSKKEVKAVILSSCYSLQFGMKFI